MFKKLSSTDDRKILELIVKLGARTRDNTLLHNIYAPEVQHMVSEDIVHAHYFRTMKLIWSTHVMNHTFDGIVDPVEQELEVMSRKCDWLKRNAYPHPPLMFELGIALANLLVLEHAFYKRDLETRNREIQTVFKQVCQIFMDADFLTRLACENTNDAYLMHYDGACRKKYSSYFDELLKVKGYTLDTMDSNELQCQIMSSKKRILVDIQTRKIPFPDSTWVLSFGLGVERREIDSVVQNGNESLIIDKYTTKLKNVPTLSDELFYWSTSTHSTQHAMTFR